MQRSKLRYPLKKDSLFKIESYFFSPIISKYEVNLLLFFQLKVSPPPLPNINLTYMWIDCGLFVSNK